MYWFWNGLFEKGVVIGDDLAVIFESATFEAVLFDKGGYFGVFVFEEAADAFFSTADLFDLSIGGEDMVGFVALKIAGDAGLIELFGIDIRNFDLLE